MSEEELAACETRLRAEAQALYEFGLALARNTDSRVFLGAALRPYLVLVAAQSAAAGDLAALLTEVRRARAAAALPPEQ